MLITNIKEVKPTTAKVAQGRKIINSVNSKEFKRNTGFIPKISNYIISSQIGQGAYAIVKQAINKKTKEKFAIKIYEKSKMTESQRMSSINREINLLKQINHPNIVKLYEVIDTPRQLCIVMELAHGQSLHSFAKSKTNRRVFEKTAIIIFRQILSGIEYCHSLNIVHRDIKMENILVDENLDVKIIDFGFGICSSPTQRLKVFCGTPSYMAPEIISKKEYLGLPTDIWSLGVLLFAMIYGHFPFRGGSERELFKAIEKGNLIYPPGGSPEIKSLISKMLQTNPIRRPTATQVIK